MTDLSPAVPALPEDSDGQEWKQETTQEDEDGGRRDVSVLLLLISSPVDIPTPPSWFCFPSTKLTLSVVSAGSTTLDVIHMPTPPNAYPSPDVTSKQQTHGPLSPGHCHSHALGTTQRPHVQK